MFNTTDYEKKYLKYDNKIKILSNLIGGNNNKTLTVHNNCELTTMIDKNSSIKELHIIKDKGDENYPSSEPMKKLKKIEMLYFGVNKPLNDSLINSTNLKSLEFGDDFNQPLGNSLNNAIFLQKIRFGTSFNQPLNDSLKNLVNLKELFFVGNYNQPFGNSLNNLHSLEILTLSENIMTDKYNFVDTLNNFVNNKKQIEHRDETLHIFDNVSNKLRISFGEVNIQIPTKNSKNIYISDDTTLNELKSKTNIETLVFVETFNNILSDNLKHLTNLKRIFFNDSFNQPLDDSLKTQINLEYIQFGKSFNKPLGDSLNNCVNLKYLLFGDDFIQPFNKSLNNLHSLELIRLSKQYYKKYTIMNAKKTREYVFEEKQKRDISTHFLDDLINLKQIRIIGKTGTEGTKLKYEITHTYNF